MVRTGNDRCTLVIDMPINNNWVEAVVDCGAQVSVLSRILYDSMSCRPRPVESIRLKDASAYGVMVVQIAFLRWSNVGSTLYTAMAQGWHTTLGQCSFDRWRMVGSTL